MASRLPNFFRSAGYANESLHTGALAYLVELSSGDTAMLDALLPRHSTTSVARRITPVREWMNADLAFIGEDGVPVAVFEFKVDAPEGAGQTRRYRTVISEAYPGFSNFFYVTLGLSEFAGGPSDKHHWRWIRLREFYELVAGLPQENLILQQWRAILADELDLRDRAFRLDASKAKEYRPGSWNLYLFAVLMETLLSDPAISEKFALSGTPQDDDSRFAISASLEPPGPDTILNFDWLSEEDTRYMEINANGKLNLKLTTKDYPDIEAARGAVSQMRQFYGSELARFKPQVLAGMPRPLPKGGHTKSITLMQFDIGLTRLGPGLVYRESRDASVGRLRDVLLAFYAQ